MKPLLMGLWMGVATGVVGFDIADWQFWFLLVPTCAISAIPE